MRPLRAFWAIYKRELFAMFVTPLAWVLIVAFLLLQGEHFAVLAEHFAAAAEPAADEGPVQAFFGQTIFLYLPLLVLCPGLTMRLFAEERRSGTIETLLTAPVTAAEVVLAKFAAALTTYVAMWAPTALYMVVVRKTGDVDWRVVGAGYLGVVGVGAGYLSVGLMMSALAKNQVTALVLTTLVTLGLFMFGVVALMVDEGALHDACDYVSVWGQMAELSKGIVDVRRLAFDATLIALPLFLTTRVVDSWRLG